MLYGTRELDDGRVLHVYPLTYGRARLAIGPNDDTTYDNEWWYDTPGAAVVAMGKWNPATQPEPEGWMRHPASGRRRPDGDPNKEYTWR